MGSRRLHFNSKRMMARVTVKPVQSSVQSVVNLNTSRKDLTGPGYGHHKQRYESARNLLYSGLCYAHPGYRR
jgi:hypothetical protein